MTIDVATLSDGEPSEEARYQQWLYQAANGFTREYHNSYTFFYTQPDDLEEKHVVMARLQEVYSEPYRRLTIFVSRPWTFLSLIHDVIGYVYEDDELDLQTIRALLYPPTEVFGQETP